MKLTKIIFTEVKKCYVILFVCLLACFSCEWRLKPSSADDDRIEVRRYDRIESQYLTTGDFSALQQMNVDYPIETRTLIEDVIRIGRVNESDINAKLLRYYQDTTLQAIVSEAELQYASMDDINKDLNKAFGNLRKELPNIKYPEVYAQIGSLDQSIVVGEGTLGISLDKYLGESYAHYAKFYPEQQRKLMKRSMIVPDCMVFYILSLFPMTHDSSVSQLECDVHMGKILWTVNKITGRKSFNSNYVDMADQFMKKNKRTTVAQLLAMPDSTIIKR